MVMTGGVLVNTAMFLLAGGLFAYVLRNIRVEHDPMDDENSAEPIMKGEAYVRGNWIDHRVNHNPLPYTIKQVHIQYRDGSVRWCVDPKTVDWSQQADKPVKSFLITRKNKVD
jgi:hypothetical protein